MLIGRRRVVQGLGSFVVAAPSLALLSGCNTTVLSPERQKVALLLPLTGQASSIGLNLEQAARLTSPQDDPFVQLEVFDTRSDVTGAGAAASKVMKSGAKVVLGPVFRNETEVAATTINGRIPLIAFTNDTSQAANGAFVFGLTPDQSVAAILDYARRKGITSLAVVTQAGEVSRQAADAAQRIASKNGMRVTAVVAGGGGSTLRDIRDGSGGKLPAAVLLPGGGDAMIRDAEAVGASGMKLLGTEQWHGTDLGSHRVFEKSWFAAPVPSSAFSQAFAAQTSAAPGVLAGLAYDAVNMCRVLSASGDLNAAGITRPEGFNGALGKFNFRQDRTCDRTMAILTVENGAEQVIATSEKV